MNDFRQINSQRGRNDEARMTNAGGNSNDENSAASEPRFVPHQLLRLLNECVFNFVPVTTCREQIARHGEG
jgi:hypothetical protein